ncbi:MAG TPA: GntR family transcriptional regulator [Candidatus Dormibacteraeota bacterium]
MAGSASAPAEAAPAPPQGSAAGSVRLLELDLASLRSRAYEAIRSSIITGELAEDEIYPVSFFAARLGVSATPIREALFDLAGDGLIEVVRNRGFKLPRLSERDMDELHELRLMVELPGVVRVAATGRLREPRRLRQLALDLIELADRKDAVEYLTIDRAFHLELISGLENQRLVRLVALLRDQARFRGIRRLAESGDLMSSAHEHLALLEVVAAGDVAGAESAIRAHLAHTRLLWEGVVAR